MMKYFKDPETGDVYAYEADGSQDEYIKSGLVEMSVEDVEEHLRPNPPGVEAPYQVTRAQGKAALISAGLWGQVAAFVDSIEDETEQALARVALDDTTHWQRSSPFLARAAEALSLSDEQMDELFLSASKIEL